MASNRQLARSFAIFAEYDPDGDAAAEHDQLFAGPDPSDVSTAHYTELVELGWHPDPDGTWKRWV